MTKPSYDRLDLEAYRVAKDARSMEIDLFWRRSNYFLVLSTAIAAGFFSLRDVKYAVPLAVFGLVVALLWIAVNLGSKFWQSRWEYRAGLAEKRLRPDMNLLSASWESVQDDVRKSLEFRERGVIHSAYMRLVLLKPSVSLMMTALSLAFVGFWVLMLIMSGIGNRDETGNGGHDFAAFLIRHENSSNPFWLSAVVAASSIFQTLAIVIGAFWAVCTFAIRRESKPALDIALASRVISETKDRLLACFDVTFTNKGKCRVLARKREPGLPAFSDRSERLQHSVSLLLRRVDAGGPPGTQVRWFTEPEPNGPVSTEIVANLLEEYEYDVEGKEDFWVEPSEVSHLSVGIIIEPGVYLAMVTFVGQPGDGKEFWRRQFIVKIPEQDAVDDSR